MLFEKAAFVSISSWAIIKCIALQQKKGGKKSQKAKLAGGVKGNRHDAMDDLSQYDDFDDFM